MKNLNIPPVWTLLAVFGAVIVHLVYPLIVVRQSILALVLVLLGCALIVWPAVLLKRNKTTVIPRRKPSALVAEGPFKISRNPMYLGMVLIALGVGFFLGSFQALFPAVWLIWFFNKNYVIPEERKMKEALGWEATDYFASTGRWLWFL